MIRTLALSVLIAALAACSDSTAPSTTPLAGSYMLLSVSGDPLPVAQNPRTGYQELIAGTITVKPNGDYTQVRTLRRNTGPVEDVTTTGRINVLHAEGWEYIEVTPSGFRNAWGGGVYEWKKN